MFSGNVELMKMISYLKKNKENTNQIHSSRARSVKNKEKPLFLKENLNINNHIDDYAIKLNNFRTSEPKFMKEKEQTFDSKQKPNSQQQNEYSTGYGTKIGETVKINDFQSLNNYYNEMNTNNNNNEDAYIKSFKNLEELKANLNQQLLNLLAEERLKEDQREMLLSNCNDRDERIKLEKIINFERSQASQKNRKIKQGN